MPGTDGDRVVIRGSRFVILSPAFLMVNGLTMSLRHGRWWLAMVPLGVAGVVLLARVRTELAPDGITTCDGVRTKRLSWDDVIAVDARSNAAKAVLRDDTTVALPGVLSRAWAPEGDVARNAAQRVTDYATIHGFGVELRTRP